MEFWRYIIGLIFVSLILGNIIIATFLLYLRRWIERREDEWKTFSTPKKWLFHLGISSYPPAPSDEKLQKTLFVLPSDREVAPWITGMGERLFFTLIVAWNISGTAVAMVAWIALKMIASRPYREKRAKEEGRVTPLAFEFAGLLGNLSSMLFALLGGMTIRWLRCF